MAPDPFSEPPRRNQDVHLQQRTILPEIDVLHRQRVELSLGSRVLGDVRRPLLVRHNAASDQVATARAPCLRVSARFFEDAGRVGRLLPHLYASVENCVDTGFGRFTYKRPITLLFRLVCKIAWIARASTNAREIP